MTDTVIMSPFRSESMMELSEEEPKKSVESPAAADSVVAALLAIE